MNTENIFKKALNLDFINMEEAKYIYYNADITELMFVADQIRQKLKNFIDTDKVGWIIDRNINISNICVSMCKFCNFCRAANSMQAYTTTIEQYRQKINELYEIGGRQILLQGGLNPDFKIDFYENLFQELKKEFPDIKLHALGPPEIFYIAQISHLNIETTLNRLITAGLDSLPGAGAEILVDRVRKIVAPIKCNSQQWLDVMRIAHKINLPTSATMMFGHVETLEERLEHIIKLRNLQAEKPLNNYGFVTFVLWPLQSKNTVLEKMYPIKHVTASEYVRMLAISRILFINVPNIQASWLTVGKDIAQVCLHAGANDFGSIMMEENVVASAGSNNKLNINAMQHAIRQAGFIPMMRNVKYEQQLNN